MPQRDPEWYAIRCGKITASRIADIMAVTKSGPSSSRKNYLAVIVAERLTGVPAESYTSAAMQWGIEMEAMARDAYRIFKSADVQEVDFVVHPSMAYAGASPDGLVGSDGLIEIKCPNTSTHIEHLITRNIPQKYVYQMQFQMACTSRAWCDFVSFDPRLPERLSFSCVRVDRDDAMIETIESAVRKFDREVCDMIRLIEGKSDGQR